MTLSGQELRNYIYWPWHFSRRFTEDRPFQLKYENGKCVTIDSVDVNEKYEVIFVKRLLYGGDIPFDVFKVKKVV